MPGLKSAMVDGWRLLSLSFSMLTGLGGLVDAAVVFDQETGREAFGSAMPCAFHQTVTWEATAGKISTELSQDMTEALAPRS